ncbi:MAG: site-specific integrase [Alphaproteobacteria bacterium]|nr:site-specific integrase [Alphaproteobacteria bacterium]
MYANPKNERVKRAYLTLLEKAYGKSKATADHHLYAITRYENFSCKEDFALFNLERALAFKKELCNFTLSNGKTLSKSTIVSVLHRLEEFFRWLATQPGYKSKVKPDNIAYLRPLDNDLRIAQAKRFKEFPTVEQCEHLLRSMPFDTETQRRDRALIALLVITGMRDSAIRSLCMKHVDIANKVIYQDPHEVKTKFRNLINTPFLPVSDLAQRIFIEWYQELRTVKLFGNDDPVMPQTLVIHDKDDAFTSSGQVTPKHWKTTGPIRRICKEAWESVGIKYYTPHRFRDMVVDFGQTLCTTPEDLKAWSKSLGHKEPMTTITCYAHMSVMHQIRVIRVLAQKKKEPANVQAKLLDMLEKLSSKMEDTES